MRLDVALVERGLARSRTHARALIDAGRVELDGAVVTKASTPVEKVTLLAAQDDGYVSRAAHKLLGALDESTTAVAGRVLDAGASTGGFTQVVLERGAAHVYAVDVGHGQLDPSLRADARVTVRERTNLRDLTLEHVGGQPVDLVVADVSFISLTLLVGPLLAVLAPTGTALLMVKPQFEVGRERLGRGGVVRDDTARLEAVAGVVAAAQPHGWSADWQGVSRLPGPAGNVEYFVRLRHVGGLR